MQHRNKAGTTVILTRQIPLKAGGGFESKVDLGAGVVQVLHTPFIDGATIPQTHIAAAEHMRTWLQDALPEDPTWRQKMFSGRISQTRWAHVLDVDLLAVPKVKTRL